MAQIYPFDKNMYVQDYLYLMRTEYMSKPELYFDPETGELFNEDMPWKERHLLSVNSGLYPLYACTIQNEYIGYFNRDRFVSKEEEIKRWSK